MRIITIVCIPYSEANAPTVSKDLFFSDALTFGINKTNKHCHCCFCCHNWTYILFIETKAEIFLKKDLLKTERESHPFVGEMVLRQWDDAHSPSSLSWSFQQYRVACSMVAVREVANHGSQRGLLTIYSVIFFCKFLLWESSHTFCSTITQVLIWTPTLFHYIFLSLSGDTLTRSLCWSLKHLMRGLESKSISWREALKGDLPRGFRDNPGLTKA